MVTMTELIPGHARQESHQTSHRDKDEANHNRLHRLTDKLKHPFSSSSSSPERGPKDDPTHASLEKRRQQADRTERLQQQQDELVQSRKDDDEAARDSETSEEQDRWGQGSLQDGEIYTLDDIAEWDPAGDNGQDKRVTFRGRIEHQRKVSPHLIFLLIRDTTHEIQCVLRAGEGIPEHMVKWAGRLSVESLVEVSGTLHRPPQTIKSATIQLELEVSSLHTLSPAQGVYYDNYRPPEQMHQRLAHRLLDLRHPANHALFRIRAAIVRVWRDELDKRDFLEIHTPKLQPAATESGAEVFKVDYFGRTAFLAQSPQLAKQMAISADMKRIYEIGPVFRAENSNTHRHLTEYTGLDLEMEISQSYHEVMDVLIAILRAIIQHVQAMPELATVRERFPSEDFLLPDEVPVIPFPEGLQMLRDDGRDVAEEDLSTRDEIRLGELVRDKYRTDLYVLDKFPTNARPFYTHLDDQNPKWTNSFDMFLRGQEVCTGGQRLTDPRVLRQRMKEAGTLDGMDEYLEAFDNGAPPHGGAGLGLERVVFLLLNLGDVRYATLFHRDPKSLPARAPSLPHPEADTTRLRASSDDPTPIEHLIHNYGDSSNTSWLDPGWTIWRQDRSGAAIAYKPKRDKLAMMIGDPLCDPEQFPEVLADYLAHLKQNKLKPIFMLVSERVQAVLAQQHGMRTFTCAEEQRLDPQQDVSAIAKQARRKADRQDLDVAQVSLDRNDFIARAEKAIDAWKSHRGESGTQMHMTEIRPFEDRAHRQYFSAEKDGTVHALVVLARLSPQNGFQVKWALDFPGAPNGAIEATVSKALEAVNGSPVTFGGAASASLQSGAQIRGIRAKGLEKTYASIATTMGLGNKTEFREQFGTAAERLYICYPKNHIGPRDLKEIVAFFQD